MVIKISDTKTEVGLEAAESGAIRLRRALDRGGQASIVLASGASQFKMLESLVAQPDIDWSRVVAFHLDEYIDLPAEHPASFRRYLRERFVERLPGPIGAFHWIAPEGDPEAERRRLSDLVRAVEIDVAFIGIGENGHLAFNDPPADFETEEPYLIVDLDTACRRQQLGEGWFDTLEDVPRSAISMSVPQILKARSIICTVPDARKAVAVREAVEGPVTPKVPASALQRHEDCRLFLDKESAVFLRDG